MGRFRDLRKQNVVCCFRLDRIWICTDSGQWLLDMSCTGAARGRGPMLLSSPRYSGICAGGSAKHTVDA